VPWFHSSIDTNIVCIEYFLLLRLSFSSIRCMVIGFLMHSLCLCSNMMIVAMSCLPIATVGYGPLVQRCIVQVTETNHGGGTLLLNHKKKNRSGVLPKKRKTCSWEGGRDCLFPCNDKLQNPLWSLMIKYKIQYDPWWDSFIDTDLDIFFR
jgi:hypothetical protein